MKKYHIKQKDVAKLFGFKSINSFHNSSAKERILKGIESLISILEQQLEEPNKPKN